MPSGLFDIGFQDLKLLLPLTLVITAALRRERYLPRGKLFDRQRWTYADVVVAFTVLTATAFFDGLLSRFAHTPLALLAFGFFIQVTIVVSTIYGLLRWKYKLPMSVLGFDGHALYHVAWPFSVILAVMSLIGILWSLLLFIAHPFGQLMALPGPPRLGSRLESFGRSDLSLSIALLYGLDVMMLMPAMEEILFRGFAYTPLSRRFGQSGAAILSACLWALMHPLEFPRTVVVALAGIFYAYLYQRTESLLPSLTFHIAGNTVIALVLLLRDLERADRLVLPATAASCILFLLCRGVSARTKLAEAGQGPHHPGEPRGLFGS